MVFCGCDAHPCTTKSQPGVVVVVVVVGGGGVGGGGARVEKEGMGSGEEGVRERGKEGGGGGLRGWRRRGQGRWDLQYVRSIFNIFKNRVT